MQVTKAKTTKTTSTKKTTTAAKKAKTQVKLTTRQQKVLDVITKMQSNVKGAPTQDVMAAKLGIAQHTFSEHITRLVKKEAVKVYRSKGSIKFYEIV